jgi:hypothetical protein
LVWLLQVDVGGIAVNDPRFLACNSLISLNPVFLELDGTVIPEVGQSKKIIFQA